MSKEIQSLDIQIKKLKEAGCNEIFSEKVSGAKDDREQLQELLSRVRSGDTVCVVRLDRLGRRMIKLVSLINELQNKGVQFVSLENNIDTTTPMGMLLFNVCAAFSEMERELIKERVSAGVEAARSKGRKGGRPKSLDKKGIDKLMRLKNSGELSVKQICEVMNISKSVYYRNVNNDKRN